MKQWPSYEAISSISGWDFSVGEEIHHSGFGWHTCFHPSWSCADSPGASRRTDGPEFISHHPEINVWIWQQTLQSVRADGCGDSFSTIAQTQMQLKYIDDCPPEWCISSLL